MDEKEKRNALEEEELQKVTGGSQDLKKKAENDVNTGGVIGTNTDI